MATARAKTASLTDGQNVNASNSNITMTSNSGKHISEEISGGRANAQISEKEVIIIDKAQKTKGLVLTSIGATSEAVEPEN
eukprot:11872388-Ditylum_brightwellii.AAC.1